MDLVNQTAVPGDLRVAELPVERERRGVLTGKATFRIESGVAILDDQSPLPIFAEATAVADVVHPRDVLPRKLPWFEVMLVGSVAGHGEPTRTLSFVVGERRQSMTIVGDRVWLQRADGTWTPSEPEPFERMPLSWDRAFGGTATITIDDGALLELPHAPNPIGRGFDARPYLDSLKTALNAPEGYPHIRGERRLPNLESPSAPMSAPSDTPMPVCWAPMPEACALKMAPLMDGVTDEPSPDTPDARHESVLRALTQAHPDWLIDTPEAGATVAVQGLGDNDMSFELPRLRVIADYIVGHRLGERALTPEALVVDLDARRAMITYRTTFRVGYEPGVERGMRLRLDEGWDGRPS